jgi:hypothetical protein
MKFILSLRIYCLRNINISNSFKIHKYKLIFFEMNLKQWEKKRFIVLKESTLKKFSKFENIKNSCENYYFFNFKI